MLLVMFLLYIYIYIYHIHIYICYTFMEKTEALLKNTHFCNLLIYNGILIILRRLLIILHILYDRILYTFFIK